MKVFALRTLNLEFDLEYSYKILSDYVGSRMYIDVCLAANVLSVMIGFGYHERMWLSVADRLPHYPRNASNRFY